MIQKNYYKFKRYFQNTSWIMIEHITSMVITFLATVFVARYLGPEDFGILAYAISLIGLFTVFGHMGLSGLVVRELVKQPDKHAQVLGTSLDLKYIGIIIGFLILVVFIFLSEEVFSNTFWIIFIVALSMLFNPFQVLDFWFSSRVQAKYTSIAKITAIVVASLFKIGLIIIGANVLYFAFANIIQVLLVKSMLIFFYYRLKNIPLSKWRISSKVAKGLLSKGWMILLGSLFATLYLKIDQVMLR